MSLRVASELGLRAESQNDAGQVALSAILHQFGVSVAESHAVQRYSGAIFELSADQQAWRSFSVFQDDSAA